MLIISKVPWNIKSQTVIHVGRSDYIWESFGKSVSPKVLLPIIILSELTFCSYFRCSFLSACLEFKWVALWKASIVRLSEAPSKDGHCKPHWRQQKSPTDFSGMLDQIETNNTFVALTRLLNIYICFNLLQLKKKKILEEISWFLITCQGRL